MRLPLLNISLISLFTIISCPLFVPSENKKDCSSNWTWHAVLKETCLAEGGQLGKPQEQG